MFGFIFVEQLTAIYTLK